LLGDTRIFKNPLKIFDGTSRIKAAAISDMKNIPT
jgi:hypothetical protein